MSKKVLFIITSVNQFEDGTPTGLWLEEASEPYNILTAANINVDIATINGGEVPLDPNPHRMVSLINIKHLLSKRNQHQV